MTRGRFITFEGIDGCGKTTQLELLGDYLTGLGLPWLATLEPGGTALGQKIRAALLEVSGHRVGPLAELLLFSAARAQHVEELIRPALAAGRVVLSDRFADATTAYQGYGRGFDLELITDLNRLATGGLKPDLTLVFDLEAEAGLARVAQRAREPGGGLGPDRLDREPLTFHERVRQGYRAIAAAEPTRVRLIPAAGPAEEIHQLVVETVRGLFE